MKKSLALILSALLMLLLLSSCGGKGEQKPSLAEGYETARECNMYSNLCMNGMLFSQTFDGYDFASPRTYFYDFDSMKSALLCSKPNCKHDDPETCTAFGLATEAQPVIIEKNLWFFTNDREWGDDGELIVKTEIIKAELDGSSRRKIAAIEKVDYIRTVFVKGDTIYFIIQEEHHEPHTGQSNDYRKNRLYSFDTSAEKCTDHGLILEGYSSHADIVGEYNDCLYISGSYRENEFWYLNPDGSEKSLEELAKDKSFTTVKYRFDMETGELSEWDMPISSFNEYEKPKGMFVSGGYYGYMDGDNAHIVDSEGNEMVLENYELSTSSVYTPINGYYFNINGDINGKSAYTAVDLKTGEILKINKKAVPRWRYVLTYHDGSYIIYDEIGSGEFKKVSAEEIFEVAE